MCLPTQIRHDAAELDRVTGSRSLRNVGQVPGFPAAAVEDPMNVAAMLRR
jgi:hypothetical protein